MQGSKLAYDHYLWSSFGSKLTIREFWKKNLEQTIWSKQLETAIDAVREYLTSRQESQWLNAALNYLPEGHVFRTMVYLIVGYDNVGIISPMKLRLEEGGLLDNDKVLLNNVERNRRVRDYFTVLSRLESRRSQDLREEDFQTLERMSWRTTRLWYITGCHMAQRIGREYGVETLRNLVKRGYQEFFETYGDFENSLSP